MVYQATAKPPPVGEQNMPRRSKVLFFCGEAGVFDRLNTMWQDWTNRPYALVHHPDIERTRRVVTDTYKPDSLIIALPDPDGLELTRYIRQTFPEIRILCFTDHQIDALDCDLSYDFMAHPWPVSHERLQEAIRWFDGRKLSEEVKAVPLARRKLQVALCGELPDTRRFLMEYGGVEMSFWEDALTMVEALENGKTWADIILIRSPMGSELHTLTFTDGKKRAYPVRLLDDPLRSPERISLELLLNHIRKEDPQP